MKKNIFLYLFVFAALTALYLAVSSNNLLKSNEKRLVRAKETEEKLLDSVQNLNLKVLDLQYFALENNDDALAYYDNLPIEDPSLYISDKLLETNEQKGDNPLVPYEGDDNPFKINRIKLLNHKWIIADFSNGRYWGEVLIRYELMEDTSVDFTLVDHLLYTRSN